MACCAAPKGSTANVMRWSQNQWKENFMMIRDGQIKVFSTKTEALSSTGKPRINMTLQDTTILEDRQSARRFTLDDGAMLVYFRCPEGDPQFPNIKPRNQWVAEIKKMQTATTKHETVPLTKRGKPMEKVGDYLLGDLLGEGGYAKVKSGYHIKTRERVAAKIMPLMREDHTKEIMTMSALKHENIVQLKDVVESKGEIYLIMELAKGGELFAKLCEDGRFSEDQARFYWRQILTGVLYCHKKNMCHRDLKLENLLLNETGELLKITDFGFAKDQSVSDAKTILGTAVYVAPEVLENKVYDGNQADVWSCGVILYTLLFGNYPFDLGYHGGVGPGNRRNDAIYKMLSKAEYKLSSRTTPQLKDMFGKIFEPDPKKRITIEGLLNHPWTVWTDSGGRLLKDKIAAMNSDLTGDEHIARSARDAVGRARAARGSQAAGGTVLQDPDLMGASDDLADGLAEFDSLA